QTHDLKRAMEQTQAVFTPLTLFLSVWTFLLRPFFVTPFLIAVHRFILLGEVTRRYRLAPRQPRFLRFFGWSLAVQSLVLLPYLVFFMLSSLGSRSHTLDGVIAVVFVVLFITAFCLVIFVSLRLIILFPAIAIDASGAAVASAWADSKGNFWRIFF